MSLTSTPPKCSKLLQLLRLHYHKPHASFLHLATEKPPFPTRKPPSPPPSPSPPPPAPPLSPPSPTITQIVDILKSNDKENWKENEELAQLLFSDSSHSLPSNHFLQITRYLGDSSIALNFVEHLRSTSPSPDVDSLSSAFQVVFELASREPNWKKKLLDLFNTSKQLNVPLNPISAILLIRCFGRAKLVDELMLMYDELDSQKRNSHVRNVLIDELLRNGRLDDALKVLDEMLQPNSEFPLNSTTGEIVFAGLLKGEKYGRRVAEEEIEKLVLGLGSHGVFPDSFRLTQWITKFCRRGRSNRAWDLLHAVMKLDGPVEIPSFNALLTGLGNANQFKKMNLLMKKMKEKGVLPNVVTFGISINHLCKYGRMDEALDLFEKMRQGGEEIGVSIEPDVVIYNTLIDGLFKVGRVEEGLALMRRMQSEGKCSPTTVTYNCVIDGFCKAGELERSFEIFDEMNKERVQPNVITINCLVDGLCRHGKVGSALKFYREMKEKGFDGNAVTYTTLISGFCGVNNINKAMELFDEMKNKCTPDAIVYYTLISGLSIAMRMDDVELVLSEMRNAGFNPDIDCYNVMINGYCKKNKLEKANELLKEMEDTGVNPDSFTYNTFIAHFSKMGDLKTARRLLKQMVTDKVIPTVVTYGALIHACCSVGELDEAMKIFKDMSASSRVPPNTEIYNTLIDSFVQNKRVELALSLLDDMKVKKVKPNTNTFNSIFKGLKEENGLEKVFELMDTMIEQGCHPDYITLEILTEWLSAVGKTDTLRRFVQGYKVSTSTA